MAKQLFPECDTVVIKTIQISRKADEDIDGTPGEYKTYAVIMGEAWAADGTKLQDVHQKVLFPSSDGPDPWNSDTIKKDIEAMATLMKNEVKAIEDDHTKL